MPGELPGLTVPAPESAAAITPEPPTVAPVATATGPASCPFTARLPAETDVRPVKVLAAVSVSVKASVLVRLPVPLITAPSVRFAVRSTITEPSFSSVVPSKA